MTTEVLVKQINVTKPKRFDAIKVITYNGVGESTVSWISTFSLQQKKVST